MAPYALRLAVADVAEAGTVSGRLYAISTAGSLLGTFSSALALIPLIGTRRTFIVYGLLLVLLAAAGLARRRFVVAPLALALALPGETVKGQTEHGERVIHEAETEYQYARVVQDAGGTRRLELNEGQAVHSLLRPGSYLTGDYWDEMLVLPFAALPRAPRSIAILGDAAGTTARAYGHFFARTRIDGVEIDGDLTDIGRRYFDLRAPHLHTHTADARPFLRRTHERYDVIVVDAYRQPYIPFYLTTKEFFTLARKRLRPAAWCSSTSVTRRAPRAWSACSGRRSGRSSRTCCAIPRSRPTPSFWPARCAPRARGSRPPKAGWRPTLGRSRQPLPRASRPA